MSDIAVEQTRDNQTFQVLHALERIGEGEATAEKSFFSLVFGYRVLGICALLEDADSEAFASFLARAGQARLHFLRLASRGGAFSPEYLCSSKNLGFSAALAAGDLATATDIARLSPTSHYEGLEYEDDFLLFHFMHRMMCAPDEKAGLERIVQRWSEVLEGKSSGHLKVCEALIHRERDDFNAAFDGCMDAQEEALGEWKKSLTFDRGLYATEGRIYVEGLALLRLADLARINTRPSYRFIPNVARIPLGKPLPEPDSWRSLD
jgi:hypothetical protein